MSEEIQNTEVSTAEEAVERVNDDSIKAMDAVISENTLNGAAQFFKTYNPIYHNLVNRMSSRELKRLNMRLVDFPLNDKNYNPKSNTLEGQAFLIGSQLINARVLMQQAVMIRQTEKEYAEEKLNNKNKENIENEHETQE